MTATNETRRGRIKCVVWDLDDTLWSGVLLEDQRVVVRDEIVEVIHTLDQRGILNSVASRNDADLATDRLAAAGLDSMFLYPQIGWRPKSESVTEIARQLNLGPDSIAFVDDQPFELHEVSFALPEVLGVPADRVVDAVANWPEFLPRFVTDESRTRRELYQADAVRRTVEADFGGTSEQFLATLGMALTIWPAGAEDLRRAEELTVRTHQLNSTGRTYSYERLDELRQRADHLLLMSCRVVSRGVGTVLLNHIIDLASRAGATLRGEFVDNGRNRMMYVAYKFLGFRDASPDADGAVLELPPEAANPRPAPDYLRLVIR